MTVIDNAIQALKDELDPSEQEIKNIFGAFVSSLNESLDQLTALTPSNVIIKSLLHKLKGEAHSLNLTEWAHQFEELESRLLEEPSAIHHQLPIDTLFFINEILFSIRKRWPDLPQA